MEVELMTWFFIDFLFISPKAKEKKKDCRKNGSDNTQELVIKRFFCRSQLCQEIHGIVHKSSFIALSPFPSHIYLVTHHKKWKVIESSKVAKKSNGSSSFSHMTSNREHNIHAELNNNCSKYYYHPFDKQQKSNLKKKCLHYYQLIPFLLFQCYAQLDHL